jgi:uncharacterized repeat protein (TIGR04138 family)
MNTCDSADVMSRLREKHPRFRPQAYAFVLDALRRVISGLEERRHISGRELAEGACGLAIDKYGPLARTVLEYWGVHSTEDLGDIVFALVDIGLLVKRAEDRPEDFHGVLSFEEVFDAEYPWMVTGQVEFEYQ